MSRAVTVSVVAPVHNEAEVVQEFCTRTVAVLESSAPRGWELVLVDDGSTDETPRLLATIASEEPRLRVVTLARNFGHQAAITAGLDHASGSAVVVIDSDLQDPPEVIPAMVERWREGYKVVYGQRRRRAGESRWKRATAHAFYRLVNRLSEVDLPVDAGDFRLLDRQVVDALKELREDNRYLRGMVSWVGFSQCAVTYDREPRRAGSTKYSPGRMLRLALDGITSFSERPLRLAWQVGGIIVLVSLVFASWIVVGKLLRPEEAVPGFASLMVAVLFLGGVQLLSIGLLGEYVGRVYRETKRRPIYVVAERLNLPPTPLPADPYVGGRTAPERMDTRRG